MDVNKLISDLWKKVCYLLDKVKNNVWLTTGNSNIEEDNFLGTINDADLIFKTHDEERVRVTSDGLFGIGTSTPTTALDIDGQIRLRGGNPGVGKVLVSDINGVGNWQTVAPPTSTGIIPYISTDFDPDGVTVTDVALNGKTFEIFFNDLNRFIYNEVGNQEWDYLVGGGFIILLPGFNASTNNYHLYLFIKS